MLFQKLYIIQRNIYKLLARATSATQLYYKKRYESGGISKKHYLAGIALDIALIIILFATFKQPVQNILSPLSGKPLQAAAEKKNSYEVFGFAPYWTRDKLQSVDFNVLTTLAYFGIPILSDGNLDTSDIGYEIFQSDQMSEIFNKAHRHGTRVVLTITNMDYDGILDLMDDPAAQKRAINQTVALVKKSGIDGVNVDFEEEGNPGDEYRARFTNFIAALTKKMHEEVPGSSVSVSVYASAIIQPKIHDIATLGKLDIKMFMMAYDFGYMGSNQAIPTSPLYGHHEGKYWYAVSSAVEDFLNYMPSNKLILGTPWYGYNYLIYGEPKPKADVRPSWSWRGSPRADTYAKVKDEIKPDMEGVTDYREGWDNVGKVGWKAYYVAATDTWRMVFIEDTRSLALKYDFAKSKNLAGVGMWALGFEDGRHELWDLLSREFGMKLARAGN